MSRMQRQDCRESCRKICEKQPNRLKDLISEDLVNKAEQHVGDWSRNLHPARLVTVLAGATHLSVLMQKERAQEVLTAASTRNYPIMEMMSAAVTFAHDD